MDGNEKQIVENATKDSTYAPYCLRCRTMERMEKIATYYWKCRHCRAICDLRLKVKESKQ